MRIALDSQAFTMQAYGGVSRYCAIIANELNKLNKDVKIFSGIHRNNYLSSISPEIVCGHKINYYPPKSGRFFQFLNYCISESQICYYQPDVVHESYYSNWKRWNKKAARVVTVHDMIHELYSSQFSFFDKTQKMKKIALERADRVICISENTKIDLLNHVNIDEGKVSVVYHGVNSDLFKRKDTEIYSKEKPFLLYVGSRTGYKNFRALLVSYASSDLLKSNFNIVAFGGGRFTSLELALMKSLNISLDNVKQCSGDDNDLISLYHRAAAFIYPSLYEGFGMPPLEAMAASCPVISSNASSIPEVVRDAGMYFSPLSTEDMRFAIEKVVFNETERSRLIAAGLKNINHFSWGSCANATYSEYQKALDSK